MTLYRVGKLVTASLDLNSTLEAIVDAAHELTRAESTAILVQDDGEHLVIRVGRGPAISAVGERVPVGAGVVGRALLEARPVLVDDMLAEPGRARPDLDARSGIRSYLAAPLVWRGDTLGVVTVAASAPGVFTESESALVAELAEQAAAAVAHARAYADEQARRAQLEVLNQQLAQTQRRLVQIEQLSAIGQLAHSIAHEVNTPLGVIISNLSVLANHAETLGPLAALTTESLASAHRIADIVRSVAMFARSSSADTLAPVNVEEALEAALTLASTEHTHRWQVVRDFGSVGHVLGSSSELTQVFVHLLLNAAQSLDEPGGVITISTTRDEKHIAIRIADNGHGISPENLPRIFEPFFTTRAVGIGSGLGLSVSQGIVTRHGGTIDIQSARGSGTTVSIRLVPA